MTDFNYLDFDLHIEKTPHGYQAQVVNSPAGQASAEFTLPLSDVELENFLLKLGGARRTVRRLESPEMQAAKTFGGLLFDAVFTGDVRSMLLSSLYAAEHQEAGLRIRLTLTGAPELADLPWEYLYNSSLNRFLALSVKSPIVRYIEVPERIRPLATKPPLRILVMISSPTDFDRLDVEREWTVLKQSLADLENRGIVALERLDDASLAALQDKFLANHYHVLHFVGHGGFDESQQDGVLVMETQEKRGRRVSAQYLGTLLHDHGSLRLVVLNACEGARTSRTDPFAGVAASLVQQGIPAVVAMQFEISDDAAIIFGKQFYRGLAIGYPVDAALAEARKTIFAHDNEIEWGTPVLYLRAPDGHIFDMQQIDAAEQKRMTVEALLRDGQTALAAQDWSKAGDKTKEALALDPANKDAQALQAEIERQSKLVPLAAASAMLPERAPSAERTAVPDHAAAPPRRVTSSNLIFLGSGGLIVLLLLGLVAGGMGLMGINPFFSAQPTASPTRVIAEIPTRIAPTQGPTLNRAPSVSVAEISTATAPAQVPTLSLTPPVVVAAKPTDTPQILNRTIQIWKVGSMDDDEVPSAEIPNELANEARNLGLSLNVQTFRGSDFVDKFGAAFAQDELPDIIAADNYSAIIEISQQPGVSDILQAVTGSLEQLGDFIFQVHNSTNYSAASTLSLRTPKCPPPPAGNQIGNNSSRTEVESLAVAGATAYFEGNARALLNVSDIARIGFGTAFTQPALVKQMMVCSVYGNDRLAFALLIASFSANEIQGHEQVLTIWRQSESGWKLLTITGDPVSIDEFYNLNVPTFASSMDPGIASPSLPAPAVLLAPEDGAAASPKSGDRFGELVWQISSSPNVAAEIAEVEFVNSPTGNRLFMRFRNNSSASGNQQDSISTGQLWGGGTDRWRVWSISRNGDVTLSELRAFQH